jgi:hypothetical protein
MKTRREENHETKTGNEISAEEYMWNIFFDSNVLMLVTAQRRYIHV